MVSDKSHRTLADLCVEELRSAIREDRRFWQVERSEQGIQRIVAAQIGTGQPFSANEKGEALQAGRMWGADILVLGYVVAGADGLEVLTRLVDARTGRILATPQVFEPSHDENALRGRMEDLALKFEQALPFVDGEVIETKSGEVVLNRGERARLRAGTEVLIFRPDANDGRGSKDVAVATVTRVDEKSAHARLTEGSRETDALRVGDRFVTK